MQLKELSFDYGDRTIFNSINLTIQKGDKVGLIGVNGAGKTTLFNLILGNISATSGEIILKKGTRIGLLPQVIADNYIEKERTVREYILSSRPIEQLEKKLTEIYEEMGNVTDNQQKKLGNEAQRIQEELESFDWYEYENIMLKIAYNMQITDDILNRKISELSGGQKSKVAFARLLYSKQDIMLLDEPTNHLDKETKKFVIDFLKSYKGTLLIISHDIDFLNEITNKTIFLDPRTSKIIEYNGNYSVFKKLHAEYEKRMEDQAKQQEAEIEKLETVIKKFEGTSGKRKRLAQDREKKLDKILQERIVIHPKQKTVDFNMQQARTENNIPIKAEKVTFSYPNSSKKIISKLSFEITKGERFLVVGENGAGKSTLLKLITRNLKPNNGRIIVGAKTDIGYYAQEHEGLIPEKTILENFSDIDISLKQLRAMLAHFLFYGDDVNKKVGILSPGERSRVALAKLALMKANFLVLDEPTNHLDPDTQAIIAEIFNKFEGTMLIVSHNPSFVSSLNVERMLILPEGEISYYDEKIVKKYHKLNTKN